MTNPLDKEPAVIYGAIAAIIGVAIAFGANISESQQQAILFCVASLVPLIFLIRQSVFAPDTVQKEVEQAAATGQVPAEMHPPAGTVGS